MKVEFWLDFVSPYSWMALEKAAEFGATHGIEWHLRPVVYAKLLEAFGLSGPAESDARRRYFGRDVMRSARHMGIEFVGPPAHPFRSLEALRTLTLFADKPSALELALALSRAAWSEGRDLSSIETIKAVVESCAMDAQDLHARITRESIKKNLIEATYEAIDRGIFGVPTFVFRNEHFWGQDRMDQLAATIRGQLSLEDDSVEAFLGRPRAVERRMRSWQSNRSVQDPA